MLERREERAFVDKTVNPPNNEQLRAKQSER
jgi:hypothetical protein